MPPCLVGTPAYHQNSQSKAGRSIGGFIPTKWAFGVKWWQTPNSRSECGYWSSSHWNVDNVTDFNWVAIGIFDIWKCLIWIILWYPSFYFLERWSPQRNGTSWSLSLTLLTSKGLSCFTAATSTLNAVFFFSFIFVFYSKGLAGLGLRNNRGTVQVPLWTVEMTTSRWEAASLYSYCCQGALEQGIKTPCQTTISSLKTVDILACLVFLCVICLPVVCATKYIKHALFNILVILSIQLNSLVLSCFKATHSVTLPTNITSRVLWMAERRML